MSTETPPAPAAEPAPRLSVDAVSALLAQHFPALFAGAPKPIKLRIQADIQARLPGVFSKPALSAFLRQHTGRNAYLVNLSRASHRLGLDGAPAEAVSDEHRQAALDELARRRTLRQSREQQLADERRARAALLRAFDSSTLTKANFCALKGIAPDQLDGLLERARREASEAPPRSETPRRGPPRR
jgi:sRNA-binding protein